MTTEPKPETPVPTTLDRVLANKRALVYVLAIIVALLFGDDAAEAVRRELVEFTDKPTVVDVEVPATPPQADGDEVPPVVLPVNPVAPATPSEPSPVITAPVIPPTAAIELPADLQPDDLVQPVITNARGRDHVWRCLPSGRNFLVIKGEPVFLAKPGTVTLIAAGVIDGEPPLPELILHTRTIGPVPPPVITPPVTPPPITIPPPVNPVEPLTPELNASLNQLSAVLAPHPTIAAEMRDFYSTLAQEARKPESDIATVAKFRQWQVAKEAARFKNTPAASIVGVAAAIGGFLDSEFGLSDVALDREKIVSALARLSAACGRAVR